MDLFSLPRCIVRVAPRAAPRPLTYLGSEHATYRRCFSTSIPRSIKEREDPSNTKGLRPDSDSQAAINLSQNITQPEKDHFRRIEAQSKEQQRKSPWMREGSAVPPVSRPRSAGAMVKGKLITTPSRMLKLILPLSTSDQNKDRKDIEPLALLVHPQQPLSYLERLIQSEVPVLEATNKPPTVIFRAQDLTDQEEPGLDDPATTPNNDPEDLENAEEMIVDGKRERTGKIGKSVSETKNAQDGGKSPLHGHQEGLSPRYDEQHQDFVRWSPSTEIGDFIRDAAKGKEFAVEIEGTSAPIYVGVPSFSDRTFFLRMRLRKTARRISELADLKRECDELAHRGAKRVAQLGFTGLIGWWGLVYYLTFRTELGWDVMEPVTYLVGLSGLIGGYMWFLYHNREASYRSAMNFTVSRRQSQLYEQKGFDLPTWEGLVEEGNRLRREIKMIADEYDVEWDESKDEGDEKVKEALRKARKKSGKEKDEKEDDEGDEDDGK